MQQIHQKTTTPASPSIPCSPHSVLMRTPCIAVCAAAVPRWRACRGALQRRCPCLSPQRARRPVAWATAGFPHGHVCGYALAYVCLSVHEKTNVCEADDGGVVKALLSMKLCCTFDTSSLIHIKYICTRVSRLFPMLTLGCRPPTRRCPFSQECVVRSQTDTLLQAPTKGRARARAKRAGASCGALKNKKRRTESTPPPVDSDATDAEDADAPARNAAAASTAEAQGDAWHTGKKAKTPPPVTRTPPAR